MIVGHYASALVSRTHLPRAPLWLLLLCSQIPEFLWLGLALAGVEAPRPGSILDATFANIQVEMIYSHNLIPNVVLGLVVVLVVRLFWRSTRLAIWCGALVVAHVLCDYLVGFQHQLLGRLSPDIALNLYARMPYLAILIELVFAALCIVYYVVHERRSGRAASKGTLIKLSAVFLIGILMWMPSATLSLRQMMHAAGFTV